MAERCPLCQGKIQNGECVSCGYRIPDEDDISALYNYDPSDYPQPEEEHIREITPDVQMEEIYPNRPDPIDIKVRNDQGKTMGQGSPYGQSRNSLYGQQGQYGQNQSGSGAPYYQNGNSVYRQQGQYGQQGQGTPYYRTGNTFGQYGQTGQYGQNSGQGGYYSGGQQSGNGLLNFFADAGEFCLKYWWLIICTLAIPFFGFIICLSFLKLSSIEQKYKKYLIILLIIGIIGMISR